MNLVLTKLSEMDKKIDVGFAEMDKKIDVGFAEMDKKMDVGFAELRGEIKEVRGEIKTLDTKFTGEVKNLETKIEGFNARIGFQEFVSRSLLVGVLVTVSAGAFKFVFLPSNPLN